MEITGPAAGHERMKTSADADGPARPRHGQQLRRRRHALGHLADLRGELQRLLLGQAAGGPSPRPRTTSATAIGTPAYAWGKFYDRFDLAKEPNEPNRFGWVVEIDPFDPNFVPRKRTALGRTKHEGAAGIVAADGRYVDLSRRRRALRLRLQVRHRRQGRPAEPGRQSRPARPRARSTSPSTTRTARGAWLPLVHGQGPLTAANGFASQADVLIETRRAADLLGATKMDRPEDIEANPKTQPRLRHADQQHAPQGRSGRRRQSARQQRLRPHHRDDAGRRRPRGHGIHVGGAGAAAAIPRSPRSARRSRPRRPRTAGSACRTTARSTARAGCGSRRTATTPRRPAAPTGCGRSRPRASGAAPRSTSSACRSAPRCAGPSSRRTTRRCSSPSSIRARPEDGAVGELREPDHPLARLQGRHAAAAVGAGRHEAGRRQDRLNGQRPPCEPLRHRRRGFLSGIIPELSRMPHSWCPEAFSVCSRIRGASVRRASMAEPPAQNSSPCALTEEPPLHGASAFVSPVGHPIGATARREARQPDHTGEGASRACWRGASTARSRSWPKAETINPSYLARVLRRRSARARDRGEHPRRTARLGTHEDPQTSAGSRSRRGQRGLAQAGACQIASPLANSFGQTVTSSLFRHWTITGTEDLLSPV